MKSPRADAAGAAARLTCAASASARGSASGSARVGSARGRCGGGASGVALLEDAFQLVEEGAQLEGLLHEGRRAVALHRLLGLQPRLVDAGNHQHRHLGAGGRGLNSPGHLVAVEERKQDVQHHHVKGAPLEGLEGGLSVALHGDAKAGAAQRVAQHPLDVAVVVDDEDVDGFARGHSFSRTAAPPHSSRGVSTALLAAHGCTRPGRPRPVAGRRRERRPLGQRRHSPAFAPGGAGAAQWWEAAPAPARAPAAAGFPRAGERGTRRAGCARPRPPAPLGR